MPNDEKKPDETPANGGFRYEDYLHYDFETADTDVELDIEAEEISRRAQELRYDAAWGILPDEVIQKMQNSAEESIEPPQESPDPELYHQLDVFFSDLLHLPKVPKCHICNDRGCINCVPFGAI